MEVSLCSVFLIQQTEYLTSTFDIQYSIFEIFFLYSYEIQQVFDLFFLTMGIILNLPISHRLPRGH
jgi:hypothetical protein